MNTTTNSHRTLEITVLSAEEVTKWASKNLYVVVRAESIKSYTTGFASEGPFWNQKLLMDLPVNARSITFELKCKTTSSSSSVKDVAVARIAVSDFLGGAVPDHCVQFLSYRLRDWEGRRSGILNFSVRVKSPGFIPFPVKACAFQIKCPSKGASSSGAVVTGVPVMWNTSNV